MSAEQWRVYEIRELTLPRLLKWDDRNFMAFAVEGRYPFLDHVVIETCLTMAPEVLYDRGWTKEPLRRSLHGLLPPEILRRRSKVGFETPQEDWLRGTLAPLVDRCVDAADSPLWDHVDPHAARALRQRVRTAPDRENSQALLRLVLTDAWLRRFDLAGAHDVAA